MHADSVSRVGASPTLPRPATTDPRKKDGLLRGATTSTSWMTLRVCPRSEFARALGSRRTVRVRRGRPDSSINLRKCSLRGSLKLEDALEEHAAREEPCGTAMEHS